MRTGARRYADTAIARYSRGLTNGPFVASADFHRQIGSSIAPAAWLANGGLQEYALYYTTMGSEAELIKEFDAIASPVAEYVDRMLFAFISGAKPLESFEEYATVLQVMGIDRATEILNRIRSGVDGDRP